MSIVNFTNATQAYIILSIIPPEYQNFILFPALAIFVASLVLSIIYLLKENTTHIDQFFTKAPTIKAASIRTIKRTLASAFSDQENARHLVSNLEDLKSKNIIDEESYHRNKIDYDSMIEGTNSTIVTIKAKIADDMEIKKSRLVDLQRKLEENEKEYSISSINKARYQTNRRSINKDIDRIETEIANLKALVDANGTYDATSVPD